jgi:transcriptional regulator with GAF, ATPase, and Fis domain
MGPRGDDRLDADELASRFEVVQRYPGGEGWSAAVRDRASGATRFLKILDPGVEVVEASLLASLAHPRIPRVLELGTTRDGRAWLLREHFAGVPLGADLPLRVEAATELATQLLETLAYVHLRGILHLDLKPANVLRCGIPEQPTYALLDFGLGRRGSGPATGGTAFFAAPERLLGMEPDARSDLFSLGALLFVALRSSGPSLPWTRFCARFPREDFFAAVGTPARELPAPFADFLARLLHRRPNDRPADAQEALESLVGGTGRPSIGVLRPDPIRVFGARLERMVEGLEPGRDVAIFGGDASARHALAVHVACTLDGVAGVRDLGEVCEVRRGGGEPASFRIEPLRAAEIAAHLEEAVGLPPRPAEAAARELLRAGADTPAAVEHALMALAEQGRIHPDGARWIWPDAVAGRSELTASREPPATPRELRDLASRGHVEAALRAFRVLARARATDDNDLRAALAEGLLLGGEPGRALPLVHDLPVLRARALFDLGRVHEADRQLRDARLAAAPCEAAALDYLAACIACRRGDLAGAEAQARRLAATAGAPEHRVLLGEVLRARGRLAEALLVLRPLAAELRGEERPFLRVATLNNMARAERALGESDLARAHLEEALAWSRVLGHVRHTATASLNLGVIAKDRGELAKAREHLRLARSLYQHVDDRGGAALAEANLGVVSLEEGDASGAKRRLQEGLAELERLGSTQDRPLLLLLLARAHAALGERELAESCMMRAGPLTGRLVDEAEKARRALAARAEESAVPAPAPAAAPPRDDGPPDIGDAVFQTFLAVNRRLATEADLERALRFLLDAAVTLAGGRSGYLLIKRQDGVRSELRTGESQTSAAFSRSLVNRALQRRHVLTNADALADRELADMPSVRDLRLRSVICVPFVSSLGVEGALYVEHPGRADAFGAAAKRYLDLLVDQAAIAVDRMLHEEKAAAELEQSRRDLHAARRELARSKPSRLLGRSNAMKALRETIDKLAPSDLSVLVLGETGSGKELVARALHERSARHRGNFVSENCSAIPHELMESEMFGHRKGAFTGADEDRPGLLELASGGTLFLDEVGDMPLPLQAKLLRVLQERAVRRVGDQRTTAIDIRLVTATHRDLQRLVAEGQFREDLFFRLAAAEIRVPPLRERDGDVVLLAEEFLARLNREHRRDVRITEQGKQRLRAYPWPGNVRELEHVIARAFILSDGDELSEFGLPEAARPAAETGGGAPWPVITLAEAEARTIRAALRSTGGDKTKAARLLGISRTALYQKLRRMKEVP